MSSAQPAAGRSPEDTPGLSQVGRNTALNAAGSLVPMLLALITIPLLLKGYGVERFGVIAMSLTLTGYFSLFDFGLGRATTRFLAEASSHDDLPAVAGYFWSSLVLNVLLGLVGAAVVVILAPWLATRVFALPPSLEAETTTALYWLAACVPLLTTGSSLTGALEGHHRFDLVNTVQVPSDIAMRLAPLAVLPFTLRVDVVIAVLVGVRILSSGLGLFLCLEAIPALRSSFRFERDRVKPLLAFGGWLTVTNVIGPVMTYLDRFVIGSFLSMAAVTYYIVPFDLLRRLQVLPYSLGRTLFPLFGAQTTANLRDGRLRRHYEASLKYLAILMGPAVIILMALGGDFLGLWLGRAFAEQSTLVMQVLLVGVFLNALSKPPYSLIQASGRPDVTAKFHLVELLLYLPILFGLMFRFGITGVAIAWALRVAIDAALLRAYAGKLLGLHGTIRSVVGPGDFLAFLLMAGAWGVSWLDDFGSRLLATIPVVVIGVLWSWFRILSLEERLEIGSRAIRIVTRKVPSESKVR